MRWRGSGPNPPLPAPPPRLPGLGADAGDSVRVRAVSLFQRQWQAWSSHRTCTRHNRHVQTLPARVSANACRPNPRWGGVVELLDPVVEAL
eukprot:5198016-Pyramimonas_sp.AAC.1